ncbi:MAG: carbohydrate binding domain-containing protein [Planctomycetes bacterium]|nr:carbohydrate binding domain-containing protein [Planctomycetota bacterium]
MLAAITKDMLAREAAWDVIINGDMAAGGARPFAWDHQWVGKGKVEVARDTTTSVSAPASLRLRSLDGPAQASVEQPLRGVAGRTVTVTAQVRNAGFSSVALRITGLDGAYKQALNQVVIDATAATAWTRFEGSLAIPAEVPNCRLGFAVDGSGSAWLDDVVVTVSDTPAAPAGTNLLRNGGMEDGDAQPIGWTSTWAGSGKVAAARDTAVFHGGKAALRVDSVGGAAKGNASQAVEGLAGKRVRITGWVRGDGKAVASVGAGSFDAGWKQLGWETLLVVPAGAPGEWTAFDKTFTVPAGTAKVCLGAAIDGDGKAWFDDLALCEAP